MENDKRITIPSYLEKLPKPEDIDEYKFGHAINVARLLYQAKEEQGSNQNHFKEKIIQYAENKVKKHVETGTLPKEILSLLNLHPTLDILGYEDGEVNVDGRVPEELIKKS